PSLTLAADAGTNTLLAVGEPRLLGQVAGLIQQLDVRQPQVMLEVTVVSLNDAQSLERGVELQAREESGSVQGAVSSLFGLGSPDVNAGAIGAGGTGFTGVVLSPGDYSVLLQALETVNVGRSASRPKVLVNNNE